MSYDRSHLGKSALIAVALGVVASAVWPEPGAGHQTARRCGQPGFSYAGVADLQPSFGVRATLTPLVRPHVTDGDVAAWAGFGGPGEGPRGVDQWIQIGISTFTANESRLYFEINRPGRGIHYTPLRRVAVGMRIRISVLAIAGRPGWWRLWVNGIAVSPPVYLAETTAGWRAMVTTEMWDGGTGACNPFAYRFDEVEVLPERGGAWVPLRPDWTFTAPGLELIRDGASGFTAQVQGARELRSHHPGVPRRPKGARLGWPRADGTRHRPAQAASGEPRGVPLSRRAGGRALRRQGQVAAATGAAVLPGRARRQPSRHRQTR